MAKPRTKIATTRFVTLSTYAANRPVTGTAVTVLLQPGDNWMMHVAAEQLQEGDVIESITVRRATTSNSAITRRSSCVSMTVIAVLVSSSDSTLVSTGKTCSCLG